MRPAPPPECGLVASAATTQPLQPPRSTPARGGRPREIGPGGAAISDRKSTRLNSSHSQISYAVFCWKKKQRRRNGRGHVVRRRHDVALLRRDACLPGGSCSWQMKLQFLKPRGRGRRGSVHKRRVDRV